MIVIPSSTRSKVVSVHSRDNLANRMIQFMVALTLSKTIYGAIVTGARLPEWQIPYADNPDPNGFDQVIEVSSANVSAIDIEQLSTIANNSASINIILADYMQRVGFFGLPQSYAEMFPPPSGVDVEDDELLINIRAGDILGGVEHYPVMPARYYRWLAETSGLRPVLCGQLDGSRYATSILRELPRARVIESRGPLGDFQLVRSARHIAISVSTFSWLAAWLSRAQTIFLPLCGFLSPTQMRNIDLLPTADPRYRFIQMPLFFGVEEEAMLQHHGRLEDTWKQIPARQVALLKDATPLLSPMKEDTPFERIWYTHTYIEAAKEISDGWYKDPLHHYLEVGRLRGYHPTRLAALPEAPPPPGRNLARNGLPAQSSVSRWSQQPTIAADAATAINGRIWEDKYFHTDFELYPWWCVDLRAICAVTGVRIYNREGQEVIQRRASPLVVEGSLDCSTWFPLFQTPPDLLFGGRSGRPLQWTADAPIQARYIRVVLPRQEYLHLAEVEVYGTAPPTP